MQILPFRSHLPLFRCLFHSEVLPDLKAPTPNQRLSTTAHWNLCMPLRSTILPTLKTCNAPTLKQVVIHDSRFSGMQSWLINTSDHTHCNKSSMCRSCSYNHPSISPSHHYTENFYIPVTITLQYSNQLEIYLVLKNIVNNSMTWFLIEMAT